MKITNQKLGELFQGIKSVSELKGVKFAYGMAKNRRLIEEESKILQEALKPSDKFQEYDKKRIEMCEKYADKDDKGKAKLEKNAYIFSVENKKKFDKDIEGLRKEYKKEVDDRETQAAEFQKLMEKESDYKPFIIAYEDVPEDITSDQMNGIIDLIGSPKEK